MRNKIIFGVVAGAVGIFSLASISRAAIILVNPPAHGSDRAVVSIDTEEQLVNAIALHLSFDPRMFSVKEVSDGGSVINLWIASPVFSNDHGTIDLSGIIPGGITTAKGTVVAIEIIPKQGATAGGFKVISGTVLLNDGRGTAAKLSIDSSPFPLSLIAAASSSSAPDIQAPDAFTPIIAQDHNLFGGQYFLVFSATDGQSGIDHYEVLETVASGTIGTVAGWQDATSPYLLKDQTLSSDVHVRAVDRAGNFRVVLIPAAEAKSAGGTGSPGSPLSMELGIMMVVIVILISVWLYRKNSRR